MNTKKLTLTIVFAALTVALNPAFTHMAIPAPYAPFLFYQIWEIPIVIAFILIGARSGVAISILNMLVLLAVFPGASPTGPFYNLAAILSMLLGIFVAQKLINRVISPTSKMREASSVTATTTVGILSRVGIMTVFNLAVLGQSPPIGYAMPQAVVIGYLPLIALFNATLALYTIPIGHVVAKAVKSNLKL